VIPTVSWSNNKSYGFAFSGIETSSVVAVSTIGTLSSRSLFIEGFIEMCKRIHPAKVICYCVPYSEMYDYADILHIDYSGKESRRAAKFRPIPGQMTLFDYEEAG